MKTVAILGCGPAGLLAAHAVTRAGGTPFIASRPVKSVLPGAQFLHEPIPDLTGEPAGMIRTERVGTREGYAEKVYGVRHQPVSWDLQRETREAWDLRAAYDSLWDEYQDLIRPLEIDGTLIDALCQAFPLVISTIPAHFLCRGDHTFISANVDVVFHSTAPNNTIIYDGDLDSMITRTANIFGHQTTEFSRSLAAPSPECLPLGAEERIGLVLKPVKAVKVVGCDCDCRPSILRAGRFGTWRKGYLSHMAFEDAERAVKAVIS
jgi:hypothetical protein